MIERAACSWMTEDRKTERARREFADSAAFHDAHGDDLSKCDSWICVCGRTDSRGGSWEQLEVAAPRGGAKVNLRCNECGRIYDDEGVVIGGPDGTRD
ncbi:MAG TPA: hypothetical protein VFC31_12010 [Candidatus Limnocylindria bacterium]|nr:hypothetical protein [Candidatus Limnocylindria bacterium]